MDLEFVDERPVARAVGVALPRARLALTPRPQLGRRAAKRAFDLALTVLALPFALVVMSLAALAILVVDRQRPFYFDRRVGRGGRLFRCVKLRTMRGGTLDAYFEQH